MAHPSGVTLICEIAFTTNPLDTPVWVDVSSDVRSFSTRRGRQSELSRFEAGTATILLNNRDRKYDPSNTASPYYPNVKPFKRIRLRATHNAVTYDVFAGFIEDISLNYPANGKDNVARLTCVDMFKLLALKGLKVPYVLEVLKDSPKGYWRLNETSASQVAADSSGNSHNGFYVGEPTFSQSDPITDDVDGAVLFDGVDDWVNVGTNPSLSGSGSFSLEGWVKFSGAAAPIIIAQGGGAAPGSFQLLLTAANVVLETWDASQVDSTVGALVAGLNDNAWHHVVATRSGTTHAVYVDGTLRQSSTLTARALSTQILQIGTNGTSFSTMSLDEVAIYETALSAARIASHYAARTAWINDATGTRIGNVLDHVGVSTSDRDLDTGNSSLVSAGDIDSTVALEHIQKAEDSEDGWVFVSRAGKVTFVERHAISKSPYTVVQATFGDQAGELPYTLLEPSLDDADIWNEIVVSRRDGATQVAVDTNSQVVYGKRTLSKSGQLMNSDSVAKDKAHYLKNRYKDPILRMPQIEIHAQRDPANLWPQALGRELLDRIRVKRHSASASPINQEVHIQGISHEVTPSTWVTRFDVMPADPFTYFLVGTDQGKVGVNRVGY